MKLNEVLVPLSALRANNAAIRRATERAISDHRFAGDPDVEMPFRYYVMFSEGLARQVGLDELSRETSFYNGYYWFKRFVAAHTAKHGYDAGLEQQAFQMLENAPNDVDWSVLRKIDHTSEHEK